MRILRGGLSCSAYRTPSPSKRGICFWLRYFDVHRMDRCGKQQTHINPRHLQKLFGFGWKHNVIFLKKEPHVKYQGLAPRSQVYFDLRDGPLFCRLSFCTSGDEQFMIMMWLWYDHLENRSVYVTEILTPDFGSQDLDPDHIFKALWATFMSWPACRTFYTGRDVLRCFDNLWPV